MNRKNSQVIGNTPTTLEKPGVTSQGLLSQVTGFDVINQGLVAVAQAALQIELEGRPTRAMVIVPTAEQAEALGAFLGWQVHRAGPWQAPRTIGRGVVAMRQWLIESTYTGDLLIRAPGCQDVSLDRFEPKGAYQVIDVLSVEPAEDEDNEESAGSSATHRPPREPRFQVNATMFGGPGRGAGQSPSS